MNVLDCKDVSIRYITGDFRDIGLKDFLMRKMTHHYEVQEFWADRNITFSLKKGDMLGIIGTNGAGKSTLLKAVSGIMIPSKGSIEARGKVVALLELGSGFDADLTVRENTYLRGSMLGYTEKYMDEKYDEIIRFAELEDFQDWIFNRLSNGMKSRLAFSIACQVDPDILILDEVLSVGDGAFREKSGNRLKEILSGGVTAILVSHSMDQIRELCNKVLWLDHGEQIAFSDKVDETVDAYEYFLTGECALPGNEEEIRQMSEELVRFRTSGKTPAEAIKKAIRTLSRNAPEALNQEYLEEHEMIE
jgi:ABC-2 type transport system ATP-binding protein